MPCLLIAAGYVLLADAAVVPGDVRPAVWIDWPEGAARSDGWPAAVPAGAVAVVTAAGRAGRSDGKRAVVVAALRDAAAASRDALQDVADAFPAATDERLDVPDGQPDDPAELRDARGARRDDPDVPREDLAREDLDDRPGGQAEHRDGRAVRLRRDGRDAGLEDARRADPDERRGDDPGHPDAMRREAA